MSFIKFLVEQINCLKEENKMKNSFNQSLLFQNSSTTFPNDWFCNNDKVDDTSPASNHGYIFDDIDGKKDGDVNGEDNNLDNN